MRVILAPMQGVLDAHMRELLTAVNEYDFCVTEFVRVVAELQPEKTFLRLCPELRCGGKTPSGTPVRVQLLGQSPEWLAENAVRAVELGSFGVDLNCGCPSKTVNGSLGGASLLKDPDLIYRATRAIRQAVPKNQTVSVKVRLGWEDYSKSFEIVDAVEQGGANEITIHGRTKADGYKAGTINWQKIGEIQQRLTIPVIANGDIVDFQTGQACLKQSHCSDLMVARGALQTPNLSLVLKSVKNSRLPWQDVLALLHQYAQTDNPFDTGFYHVARIKQWLQFLKKEYEESEVLFEKIKRVKEKEVLREILIKKVATND